MEVQTAGAAIASEDRLKMLTGSMILVTDQGFRGHHQAITQPFINCFRKSAKRAPDVNISCYNYPVQHNIFQIIINIKMKNTCTQRYWNPSNLKCC